MGAKVVHTSTINLNLVEFLGAINLGAINSSGSTAPLLVKVGEVLPLLGVVFLTGVALSISSLPLPMRTKLVLI